MYLSGAVVNGILGLNAQSNALGAISDNIANVDTSGYKDASVRFQALLAQSMNGSTSNFGGVKTSVGHAVSLQGAITTTGQGLNAAINGNGFFVLNSKPDGTGQTVYSRDGNFAMKTVTSGTADKTYVVDTGGNYLMGWQASAVAPDPLLNATLTNPNGLIKPSAAMGSLKAIAVDPSAFGQKAGGALVEGATATTKITAAANLPANATIGQAQSFSVGGFDATGTAHAFGLNWTKTGTDQWNLQVSLDGAAIGATQPVTFNGDGTIATPKTLTQTVNFTNNGVSAGSSTIFFDFGKVTQDGASFQQIATSQNGTSSGVLSDLSFDNNGFLVGTFSNGLQAKLYKLPLATFASADALQPQSGNIYTATATSGKPSLGEAGAFTLNGGTSGGAGTITSQALESSNVDIGTEFTRMIITQKAYSSSSRVVQTVEQMIQSLTSL